MEGNFVHDLIRRSFFVSNIHCKVIILLMSIKELILNVLWGKSQIMKAIYSNNESGVIKYIYVHLLLMYAHFIGFRFRFHYTKFEWWCIYENWLWHEEKI